MPRRCELGCPYKPGVSYHQFPNPERNPDGFKAWVNIIGGKLETADEIKLYRKKVICDIHFTDQYRNRNNRLNALAVPTLHLHGFSTQTVPVPPQLVPPELERDRPSTSKEIYTGFPKTQADHLPPVVPPELPMPEPICDPPSTSNQIVTGFPKQANHLPLVVPPELPMAEPILYDRPSTSKQIVTDFPKQANHLPLVVPPELPMAEPICDRPSTSKQIVTAVAFAPIAAEHNYCRNHCRNQRKIYQGDTKILKSSNQVDQRFQVKHLKSEIMRLRKRNQNFKARLASIDKMNEKKYFEKITRNMTTAGKIFTDMQYNQTNKRTRGRRFNLKEKVLSLSIYKKSPKSYGLLYKYFTLPSVKSLKRLLAKVEIEPGLNKSIFIKMRETVKELSKEDRLCCLIFDEMSISPQIHYDGSKDKLKGFAWGSKKIADHVLVYMIKGIKKKFKQPVAYYFTNALNKADLKALTIKVIKYVQGTGLNILCTVCDQSTVNVSVINEMVADTRQKFIKENREWRNETIEIGKSKIIPLFDVPHLLKGVRNNLLSKDMKYYDFEEKVEKTIRWEYYKKVYEADKSYGELKICRNLTDEHIYVDKIKKMKVKDAAQIFSHSVAVAAEHLTARGDVPKECRQIVKFTKMMDNLFDSLNASTFTICNGKIYKCGVRNNSPHHELWTNAKKVLSTIKFIKVKKEKNSNKVRLIETSSIPSIKNFIRTIEGMQHLWKILSQRYLFDCMLTRNFNQDPLENFFGNIRSYGVRNTAPNTICFEGAFKSLLLNNFNSPHSLKANCENDDNDCLQTLNFFLEEEKTSNVPSNEALQFQQEENNEIVVPYINLSTETVDAGQSNYVCGWVLAKCLKNVSKSCRHCKNEINGNSQLKSNEYIRAKEYVKGRHCLLYPTQEAEKAFRQIQNITVEILKKDVPKNKLKEKIKMFLDIFVDYPFSCEIHKKDLKIAFENTSINVLVYSWCRSINRILSGKIQYRGEDDEIKHSAQLYFNKHKHK